MAPSKTPFQPHVLRDYALLADGERGAVIGPDGDIAWLSFPHWDSPAVFSALIGGDGLYRVSPRRPFVWGGFYEPGGLIWRSRWVSNEAVIESREALVYPGDPERAVLIRRVSALTGPASITVVLEPRAEYGAAAARGLRRDEEGRWTLRSGELYLRWAGAPEAAPEADGNGGRRLRLDLVLEAGEQRDLVLEIGSRPLEGAPLEPDDQWAATESHWARVVPPMEGLAARRDARHAYAVLAGLTSSTGGMVAAATTSLPERADAGRNYDYRYVWVRDQCYSGQAVAALGAHPLMDNAVRFVTERLLSDGAALVPAYTVTGERIPDQHDLDLPGYPGGVDLVGNQVTHQFQLDVFGDALLLFAAAARHDHLELEGWRAAEIAVEAIEAHWQRADAGVWELEPRHWTHSALECVAGLRAISSAPGAPPGRAARWSGLADTVLAGVGATSVHPTGRWQRASDDERIDAALLLPALRGALAPEDPRSLATFRAVCEELAEDGYCYRFRHDDRPLAEAEGAFLLCGFWMSLACLQQGDPVASARWFERNRAACGPPGLLSEEFDVEQRQLRGNLPQAFVHALLLECAVRQSEGGLD